MEDLIKVCDEILKLEAVAEIGYDIDVEIYGTVAVDEAPRLAKAAKVMWEALKQYDDCTETIAYTARIALRQVEAIMAEGENK